MSNHFILPQMICQQYPAVLETAGPLDSRVTSNTIVIYSVSVLTHRGWVDQNIASPPPWMPGEPVLAISWAKGGKGDEPDGFG